MGRGATQFREAMICLPGEVMGYIEPGRLVLHVDDNDIEGQVIENGSDNATLIRWEPTGQPMKTEWTDKSKFLVVVIP